MARNGKVFYSPQRDLLMKNKFALDSAAAAVAAEVATARAPCALLSLLQFLWLPLLFNSCALSRLLFMLARVNLQMEAPPPPPPPVLGNCKFMCMPWQLRHEVKNYVAYLLQVMGKFLSQAVCFSLAAAQSVIKVCTYLPSSSRCCKDI